MPLERPFVRPYVRSRHFARATSRTSPRALNRMSLGVSCDDKKATGVVTCVSNWGNITCTPELSSGAK
jgi:hypothetical protein